MVREWIPNQVWNDIVAFWNDKNEYLLSFLNGFNRALESVRND